VSLKECWQDVDGRWLSTGGFPMQMAGIVSLFHDATLVVAAGPQRAGALPLPPGARIRALPAPPGSNLRRKLGFLARLPSYRRPLLEEIRRADVVHVPLPGDFPLLGMVLALVMGKRLIARYGGSWVATGETTWVNRITRALMRRAAGGRNVMLATGEGSADPAPGVQWVFATALSSSEMARIRVDLSRGWSDPPRLLYAGRLSPEKGVRVLLEALSLLRDGGRVPMPRLTLAGDGPQRAELERIVAEKKLGPSVVFAGQLAREDLSTAMARADLYVQASHSEGYSKAWLDALAHGLPVLTTDVGAARSVVGEPGERGWLVPPGDARAFANRLEGLLAGPLDWPRIRRACRAFAEGRTLESWSRRIGEVCARQWGCALVGGRLESCAP
jgi:glycosyltransferase involved in cell wall biosynthesis